MLTNIVNTEDNGPGSKIHWKAAILCSRTNVCTEEHKAGFFWEVGGLNENVNYNML